MHKSPQKMREKERDRNSEREKDSGTQDMIPFDIVIRYVFVTNIR